MRFCRACLIPLLPMLILAGNDWPRPDGIVAQEMIPIVLDGSLAGWACIGVGRVSPGIPVKRVPSLEGSHFADLLRQWGCGPSRISRLLSWIHDFPQRDKIDFFVVYYEAGDHSTGSDSKPIRLYCRVGRIEVA